MCKPSFVISLKHDCTLFAPPSTSPFHSHPHGHLGADKHFALSIVALTLGPRLWDAWFGSPIPICCIYLHWAKFTSTPRCTTRSAVICTFLRWDCLLPLACLFKHTYQVYRAQPPKWVPWEKGSDLFFFGVKTFKAHICLLQAHSACNVCVPGE